MFSRRILTCGPRATGQPVHTDASPSLTRRPAQAQCLRLHVEAYPSFSRGPGPGASPTCPLSHTRRVIQVAKLPFPPFLSAERFFKKHDEDVTSVDAVNAKAAAAIEEGKANNDGKSAEQIRDEIQQELWTQPGNDDNTPEFRAKFVSALSCGTEGWLLETSIPPPPCPPAPPPHTPPPPYYPARPPPNPPPAFLLCVRTSVHPEGKSSGCLIRLLLLLLLLLLLSLLLLLLLLLLHLLLLLLHLLLLLLLLPLLPLLLLLLLLLFFLLLRASV